MQQMAGDPARCARLSDYPAEIASMPTGRKVRKQRVDAHALTRNMCYRVADQRMIQRHHADSLHLLSQPVERIHHRCHLINLVPDKQRLAAGRMKWLRLLAQRIS